MTRAQASVCVSVLCVLAAALATGAHGHDHSFGDTLQPVPQHAYADRYPEAHAEQMQSAMEALKENHQLAALEVEEKAVIIATVILAVVGVYASAASQASNAHRQFTVADARGEMFSAQRNTKAVLDSIAEINSEFKRDYEENAKRLGVLAAIKEAGQAVQSQEATGTSLDAIVHRAMVEDFLKLMKKKAGKQEQHDSEHTADFAIERGVDVGLKVGAAMSTAVHHVEPFVGAALTLLTVGKAVAGLATDTAALYAESDKEQTVAMLQRTKDAATLTSCRYWATVYTSLSQAEAPKGDNEAKVTEFLNHLLGQLKKTWRCQCAELPHESETRDYGEDIVSLTVHRGKSPVVNELNPDEPDGTQPVAAKSISLVPTKRKDCSTEECKKKAPIVDVVVSHRTCAKVAEETAFEKRIKAMGFVRADLSGFDEIPAAAQAHVCHTKVPGDTNLGQPDRYMVQHIYVKSAWGPPPMVDIQVKYGETEPTADYFRVPMSTNSIEAAWSSAFGRLVGYYARRDAFIEFKTGYSRAPCPQTKAKKDETWCSERITASVRSAQCQYHNWKLQGSYSEGFEWGVKTCLENAKKSVFGADTPLYPCAREYVAKKKTDTPRDMTWAAGCDIGCHEVFERTFSRRWLSGLVPAQFSMVAPYGGLENRKKASAELIRRVETELQQEEALTAKIKAWTASDKKVAIKVDSKAKTIAKKSASTPISEIVLEAGKLLTPPITDVQAFLAKYLCLCSAFESSAATSLVSRFEDHSQPIIEFTKAPTMEDEGSAGVRMECETRSSSVQKSS